MTGKRQERMERIRAIEREHRAAAKAGELLAERLRSDPTFGADDELRFRDARNMRANLEATFLIRLFAEFEAGLRDAWRKAFKRTTYPTMRTLLEVAAQLRYIPQDWLDDAHEVRTYRNSLVHEGDAERGAVSIAEARHRLCRFYSYLPLTW
jgi:hypothetical protein